MYVFVHRDSCRLSLNGRDSLDENKTLEHLDIVSGDLLHVIHGAEWTVANVQPQSSAAKDNQQPSADVQYSVNTILPSGKGSRLLPHSSHQEKEKESVLMSSPEMDRGERVTEQGATGAQAMETVPLAKGASSQREMLPLVTGGASHFEEFLQGHVIPAQSASPLAGETAHPGSTPAGMLCVALHMLMLDSRYLLKEVA